MPDYDDAGPTITFLKEGHRVFSRYTLTRLLGRGGMGVVWLARDEQLRRDTALKFLPEILAADRTAIDELKREVRRALELTHPHIVRIHDFVDDTRLAAISMEFVEGATLAARRREEPGGVFSPERLAPWVAQLCAALDYAHSDACVVHRDLKPANLMLDARGRLKVLDFGIAASISESVSQVSNRAGTSGTPAYMSPQQVRGHDPAVSDDLYALGATLYELLAGQPPFKTPQAFALMHQILSEPPLPLNQRRARTGQSPAPAEWEQTIAACLAKEPNERPASAGEIAARLGLAGTTTIGAVPAPARAAPPPAADELPTVRAPLASQDDTTPARGAPTTPPDEKPTVRSTSPAVQDIPPAAPPARSTALSVAPAFPSAAAKGLKIGEVWENSLGQKFVPVPGTDVWFCIWETRERDYAAFVEATKRSWANANAGAEHPAVNVSWDDAVAFCAWLTRVRQFAESSRWAAISYAI